jgi:hypothetical protein
MSKLFDEMVRSLDDDDLSVIKGYILNTVRESQVEDTSEVIQVQATGTLEALRAFARVLADSE